MLAIAGYYSYQDYKESVQHEERKAQIRQLDEKISQKIKRVVKEQGTADCIFQASA